MESSVYRSSDSSFLKDEVSPGEVDEDEAAYIIDKVKADGIDDTELELLVHIAANANRNTNRSMRLFLRH